MEEFGPIGKVKFA